MFYHASPVSGIQTLMPRPSDGGKTLLWFSVKRENVLVYLVNAIERFCRETGYAPNGPIPKWGPYGFTKDGLLQIQEYYPNALTEAYAGASGYIYAVETIVPSDLPLRIRDSAVTEHPARVAACEFVPDALEAILAAEREGRLSVLRYEDAPEKIDAFNRSVIPDEYRNGSPAYRYFLRAKFPAFCPAEE